MSLLPPFAAYEAELFQATRSMLANATVSIDGAPDVFGIFDAPGAVGSVGAAGMATTAPTVVIATAAVPDAPVGRQALVNGVLYRIADTEPDGVHDTRLFLDLNKSGVLS